MSPLLTAPLAELETRIESAQHRVWIASPYLGRGTGLYVAKLVAEAPRIRSLDVRLLTTLGEREISGGFCSPDAIRAFLSTGAQVCAVNNLHAKLYVVDDWAMLGSANLTDGGLNAGNLELVCALDVEDAASTVARFRAWWELADTPEGRVSRAALARRREPKHTPWQARSASTLPGVTIDAGEANAGYQRHKQTDRQEKAIRALERGLVKRGESPGRGGGKKTMTRRDRAADYWNCRRLIDPCPELADEIHRTLLDVLTSHRSAGARAHAAYRLAIDVRDDPDERDEVLKRLARAANDDVSDLVRVRAKAALVTLRRKLQAE